VIKRQSTAAPPPASTSKPLPVLLTDLRTTAFINGVAAVVILVGAGLVADATGYVEVAYVGAVSILPALRGAWLWRYTSQLAQQLPPRPERKSPPHWLRVWWWLRSRPPKVHPAPAPFRRVPVGDDTEVLMPRQPGEMRGASEQTIIKQHRYTASDVYLVVCRASNVGLSERATDKSGQPVWLFGDGQRLVLPSGAQLSRAGFRAIQAYLVDHGHAVAKPNYAFRDGVTPETILEAL
jgi:hypothetical protein